MVWEGNGGGASSTEGGMWVPNDGLELVMCMLVSVMFPLSLTSMGKFVTRRDELPLWVL